MVDVAMQPVGGVKDLAQAVPRLCRLWGAAVWLVTTACASDGTAPPPVAEPSASEPGADATPPQEESGADNGGSGWDGRIVEAGHPDLRVRFRIPTGFRPLEGVVRPSDPQERILFGESAPAGIGIFDNTFAYNSIVVFSDPKGLGVDFSVLPAAKQKMIADRYTEIMKTRVPDATDAAIQEVGGYLALRMELPTVEMPRRPVRSGRHYLLFSGTATISVDCLWTDEHASKVSSGCDMVAGGLQRSESTPK